MASVMEQHPEAEVRRLRKNLTTLQGNLRNTGLNMPGADTAYRAAIFVGADAEQAWEAARRHELVMLGFADEIEEPKGLSFPSPRNSIDERRAARQRQIDSVRALVNPFSLEAPVSLERAA